MEQTKLHMQKECSIDREIWELLWPLLVLTAIQRLGHTFEGILVSVNSTDELAVTSLCSPYVTLITTVSYGLGIAANAFVGRLSGEGLWDSCWRQAVNMVLRLLVVASVCMSCVSALLLTTVLASAPELAAMGWQYMMPYLFGSPILLLYTLLISALRGFRDTKTGMWMTFLSVPVQIAISWIGYTIFGVAGLGYGMVIARGIGCLMGIHKIRTHFPAESKSGTLPAGSTRDFLKLGIPVSLSKAIGPVANAALNPLILSIGTIYLSASGLGSRLESYFYLPAMSMTTVAITMAAGNNARYGLKKLFRHLCLWSMTPTVCMVILAWIFAEPVWGLLTPDAALQQVGVGYWHICLLAYPLIALEMTITAILQASGRGMPALVVTAVRTWGVQLPIVWAAARFGWGATGAWMGFLMGNLTCVIISGLWAYLKLRDSGKTVK